MIGIIQYYKWRLSEPALKHLGGYHSLAQGGYAVADRR